MPLIPQEYGRGFPTAACICYQRHSSIDFYLVCLHFGSVFNLASPAACHSLNGGEHYKRASSSILCTGDCLCAVLDAAHRCPEGLADYNPESIFCSLARNMYHYPPLVIMAESQPRLYFKCRKSLKTEPVPYPPIR